MYYRECIRFAACREFRDCDDGVVVDQGVDDEFQSSKKPQCSPTH
jgi:hypothetical protein